MQDERCEEREAMVAQIERIARRTGPVGDREQIAETVLEAMRKVPRHRFVPASEAHLAYSDGPLPIGEGQTISQPYIVAIMTDLAEIEPGDRVLEVGAGCGYQTAVLAEMGASVVGIEVIERLGKATAERLRELGYDNAEIHVADGTKGWPAGAPYDAIIVTAAASGGVPQALIEQLNPGGRLIIPVDEKGRERGFFGLGGAQMLMRLTKDDEGAVHRERLLTVAFVPLIARGEN